MKKYVVFAKPYARSRKPILIFFLLVFLVAAAGCVADGGEFDQSAKQLIYSFLTLYLLSIFISFFDAKTASLLRKISYLNGASILFILGLNVWAIAVRFADILDRISQFKILGK